MEISVYCSHILSPWLWKGVVVVTLHLWLVSWTSDQSQIRHRDSDLVKLGQMKNRACLFSERLKIDSKRLIQSQSVFTRGFPSVKTKLTPWQLLSHLQQSAAAEQKEQSSTCRIRSHWSTRLTQMWFSGYRRSLLLRDWVKADSRRSSPCVLSFPPASLVFRDDDDASCSVFFWDFPSGSFSCLAPNKRLENRERITSCVSQNISKKELPGSECLQQRAATERDGSVTSLTSVHTWDSIKTRISFTSLTFHTKETALWLLGLKSSSGVRSRDQAWVFPVKMEIELQHKSYLQDYSPRGKRHRADGRGCDRIGGKTRENRRCCVKVCSPVDTCFLTPPRLETLHTRR